MIKGFVLFFQKLASSFDSLSKAYTKVVDVTASGKRLLGKYFRIAFFGVRDSLLDCGLD
jgi:hypothetical protein